MYHIHRRLPRLLLEVLAGARLRSVMHLQGMNCNVPIDICLLTLPPSGKEGLIPHTLNQHHPEVINSLNMRVSAQVDTSTAD